MIQEYMNAGIELAFKKEIIFDFSSPYYTESRSGYNNWRS